MGSVDQPSVTVSWNENVARTRTSPTALGLVLLFVGLLILTLVAAKAQQQSDGGDRKSGRLGPSDVPALISVLLDPADKRKPWHSSPDTPGHLKWGSSDPKLAALKALIEIGDSRVVPVLERLLREPPKDYVISPASLSGALYLLTGKRYTYNDYRGLTKLYEPEPLIEEEWRERFRPDLKPVNGLTASLQIRAPQSPQSAWLGSKSLVLTVSMTNHGRQAIEIDLAPESFVFSAVGGTGKRTNVSASDLPQVQPTGTIEIIQPGKTVSRTWTIEKLAQSSLSRTWTTSNITLRCEYRSPRRRSAIPRWRGEELLSNSVTRFYFQNE